MELDFVLSAVEYMSDYDVLDPEMQTVFWWPVAERIDFRDFPWDKHFREMIIQV
jgi:hypothetical protein